MNPPLSLLFIVLFLFALQTHVHAGVEHDVPNCAIPCGVRAASGAGCTPQCDCLEPCFIPCADLPCICKAKSVVSTAEKCITSSCSSSDQKLAQSALGKLCSGNSTATTISGSTTSTSHTSTSTSVPNSAAGVRVKRLGMESLVWAVLKAVLGV